MLLNPMVYGLKTVQIYYLESILNLLQQALFHCQVLCLETVTNSWLRKDYLGDQNHETIVLRSVSLLFLNADFHDKAFFYVLELNAYIKDNLDSRGSMFLTPNYCYLPLYSNPIIYSSCLGPLNTLFLTETCHQLTLSFPDPYAQITVSSWKTVLSSPRTLLLCPLASSQDFMEPQPQSLSSYLAL